ncbi:MAG: succinate CoA transferase [Syntrophales bacterium]|nr:succinate CoA transferase [Syntrophales bacterium]
MDRDFLSRIRCERLRPRIKTAEEAAGLIKDGMHVGTSGFTPCGYPKVVPLAVAERVKRGEKITLTVGTGASVGRELDETWASLGIIERRYPYQTGNIINRLINEGVVAFTDIHLSQVGKHVRQKLLGPMDLAIVEAVAVTEEGGIVPSTSVGSAPVFVAEAKDVVIEINTTQPPHLEGMHDIFPTSSPPLAKPIPICRGDERIGLPFIPCNPEKIAAIVHSTIPDEARELGNPDETTEQIARHLIDFLLEEFGSQQLPPIQSGVGPLANHVLKGLLAGPWETFVIWSEVIQDAVLDMINAKRIQFASGTSLSPSPAILKRFYEEIDKYVGKIILRPQEISNHPEIIRRLNLLSMNAVLEIDIYGNANSTHIFGSRMVNGIGGSGDFSRNAGLVIMMTPSITKEGKISRIVPLVTHVDHTEHEVHVVVTEQGVADLRGKTPREKAMAIIENCSHPTYKPLLKDYLKRAMKQGGHTPILLEEALQWHIRCVKTGSMKM